MKILFVLNGSNNTKINKNFLKTYDLIVAVDGGLFNLNGFEPDYIVGDFDSINQDFIKNTTSKLIFKDNQDESDFFFGLKKIISIYGDNIEFLDVICAIGDRLDHSLCNLLTLLNFDLKIRIIGQNEEIFLFKGGMYSLPIKIGSTISIIPLSQIKNIMTHGLKWEYEGIDLDFGFVNGISNIAMQDKVLLSFDTGALVVVINDDIVN